MIHILGLLGRAGSGKTTVAKHLVSTYDAKVCPLAGPLKEVARRVMGFAPEQLYGSQEQKEAVDPRYGFSAREFLQRLGTEGLREVYGEDVHFRACVEAIRRHDEEATCDRLYVIDDVRFLSEVYALVDVEAPWHAKVLRLVCTDAPATGGHSSEEEWVRVPEDAATTITNSRAQGPEHLIAEVEAALADVRVFARVLAEGRRRSVARTT